MRHKFAKQATPIYSTENASGMSATGDEEATTRASDPTLTGRGQTADR